MKKGEEFIDYAGRPAAAAAAPAPKAALEQADTKGAGKERGITMPQGEHE